MTRNKLSSNGLGQLLPKQTHGKLFQMVLSSSAICLTSVQPGNFSSNWSYSEALFLLSVVLPSLCIQNFDLKILNS